MKYYLEDLQKKLDTNFQGQANATFLLPAGIPVLARACALVIFVGSLNSHF
jgi:hypothetical protein